MGNKTQRTMKVEQNQCPPHRLKEEKKWGQVLKYHILPATADKMAQKVNVHAVQPSFMIVCYRKCAGQPMI
jgi:hypothetical protein